MAKKKEWDESWEKSGLDLDWYRKESEEGPDLDGECRNGAPAVNGMTPSEIAGARARVLRKLAQMPEEELTICDERELTRQEQLDLPEGSLIRLETGEIYLKVLDAWMWYQAAPIPPTEPLMKYGLMRKRYLEEWKVRTVLRMGKNFLLHCQKIQEQARAQKAAIMEAALKRNPAPNRNEKPMEWVSHMETLDAQAEEFVTSLIYS